MINKSIKTIGMSQELKGFRPETLRQDKSLCWRVNTAAFFKEMIENSSIDPEVMAIFKQPINIFMSILVEVGERAAEINDKKMNALMSRLAIYETSDPYNPAYNKEINYKAINEEIGIDAPTLYEEHTKLKEQVRVLREALGDLVKAHEVGMGKSAVQLRIELATEALNNTK